MTTPGQDIYSAFSVERDPFCLAADQAEGVEDKWWRLAGHLLSEKPEERCGNR